MAVELDELEQIEEPQNPEESEQAVEPEDPPESGSLDSGERQSLEEEDSSPEPTMDPELEDFYKNSVSTDQADEAIDVDTVGKGRSPGRSQKVQELSAQRDAYAAAGNIYKTTGDSLNAGGNINQTKNYYGEIETLTFDKLAASQLSRLREVFVKPTDFAEAVRRLEQDRVVLVCGENHSGKWATAVNLALELKSDVRRYPRRHNSVITLLEVATHEDFPDDAAVLVQDCFPSSVPAEELEVGRVADLREVLAEKKSMLILTGQVTTEELAVFKLSARVGNLREVMVKHVSYLRKHSDLELSKHQAKILTDKAWSRLEPFLREPLQIKVFCESLVGRPLEGEDPDAWEEVFVRWATEIAIARSQAAKTWFHHLPRNDKLFGLLVFLFAGAERRWLEALHRKLVNRFRSENLKLSDPREQGLEDSLERLKLVEIGERLEFEDHSYERELRRQVENRHHLLWDALTPFTELEPISQEDDWSEPWKRQVLGFALGRLGVHDPQRFVQTLDEMAGDSKNRRAVIPGYSFQQIIWEEISDSNLVLEILEAWVRSRDHRRMWAAGAALWRVYLAALSIRDEEKQRELQSATFGLLRLLGIRLGAFDLPSDDKSKHEKKRRRIWGENFQCVVVAMWHIALADPKQCVRELAGWLQGRSDLLGNLARRSIREVFESLTLIQQRPNSAQREFLPQVLSALLDNASDESHDVEILLLTLRAWLGWDKARAGIRSTLLGTATHSGFRSRERLRSALSRLWLDPLPASASQVGWKVVKDNRPWPPWVREPGMVGSLTSFWCEDTEDTAREIAQIVVARCYAVDGVLPSSPTVGTGIAIVDPAPQLVMDEESRAASSGALWSLLALLDSRVDLTLLRLGEVEPMDLQGTLSECEMLPSFAGHRLLMPALEALPQDQKRTVFLLAPQKPHDFEDLLAQTWLRKLFYIGPPAEQKTVIDEDSTHVELAWPPSRENLEEVCASIETHWARELASGSADLWLELLSTFGLDDLMEPFIQLETCAVSLGESPAAQRPHDDPVWKALVLSLWWAAADLSACLGWIRSWLVEEADGAERPQERVIACAASYALIGLYTAYPPDESGEGRAPTLLFDVLAEPLGRQGSDGVDAVVRLVTHWLEDRHWAQHLAGDVQEGRGRLQRWAEEFLDDRPDLASQWTKQLADLHSDQEVEQSWSALAAVMDRLKARQALKHPDLLPDLGPYQQYLLLVVDADATYKHLANVTANLYRQLVGDEEEDQQRNQMDLVPVVYRLGECRPFWAAKEEKLRAEDLLPRAVRLSRLVGPLFQASETIREQVAAVLLVTSTKPIDLDDWVESPWWDKVKLYGSAATSAVADFNTLPKPTILPGRGVSGGWLTIEAGRLIGHLTSMRLTAEEG